MDREIMDLRDLDIYSSVQSKFILNHDRVLKLTRFWQSKDGLLDSEAEGEEEPLCKRRDWSAGGQVAAMAFCTGFTGFCAGR